MNYIYNFSDLTLAQVKQITNGEIDGDAKIIITDKRFILNKPEKYSLITDAGIITFIN